MSTNIGALSVYLNANTNGFHRGMSGAMKRMKSFKAGIVLAGAVAAGAFAKMGVDAIKFASNAEETRSKYETVFKGVNEHADGVAKSFAKNFGLASSTSRQLLGDTGDLLTGFGFSKKAALSMSKQVNELAVDLASFTNFSGGATGASKALTKALLGERESIKSLGISILEADVKKQMAIDRAKGLVFETERQAKAAATMTLALAQSKNAIGDYARTSGSAANRMRKLGEQWKDFKDILGTFLIDVLRFPEVLGWMSDAFAVATQNMKGFLQNWHDNWGIFLDWLGNSWHVILFQDLPRMWWQSMKNQIHNIAIGYRTMFDLYTTTLGWMAGKWIRMWSRDGSIFGSMLKGLKSMFTVFSEWAAKMWDKLKSIFNGDTIRLRFSANVQKGALDAFNGKSLFSSLGDVIATNAKDFRTPLEGFVSNAKKIQFKTSEVVKDFKKMDREAKKQASKMKETTKETADVSKSKKFAEAATKGSTRVLDIILGNRNEIGVKQLTEAQKQTKYLRSIEKKGLGPSNVSLATVSI